MPKKNKLTVAIVNRACSKAMKDIIRDGLNCPSPEEVAMQFMDKHMGVVTGSSDYTLFYCELVKLIREERERRNK